MKLKELTLDHIKNSGWELTSDCRNSGYSFKDLLEGIEEGVVVKLEVVTSKTRTRDGYHPDSSMPYYPIKARFEIEELWAYTKHKKFFIARRDTNKIVWKQSYIGD